MRSLPNNSVKLVFFDPQYEKVRQVLSLNYPLSFQPDKQISQFCQEISRVLKPSGFCLLWVNKTVLSAGRVLNWLAQASQLKIVDLLVWYKQNILGLGSWFRSQAEFAFLLQKHPAQSKLFTNHSFGNVWTESSLPASQRKHPHQKPKKLIRTLIEATTEPGDLVVDPCAGSFIVLEVCQETKREFIGCDLTYQALEEFKTKQIPSKVCLDCWELV